MTYPELLDELRKLDFCEKRKDSKAFFEAVITRDGLSDLDRTLQGFFGPPQKPENQSPTKEDQTFTSNYGGIRKEQTLYCVQEEVSVNLAMLWPWSDGQSITVKIVQDEKKGKKSELKTLRELFEFFK